MFLERCGKFLFAKLRLPFFYLLLFTPWALVVVLLWMEKSDLETFEERFSRAAAKGKSALEKKMRKDQFLDYYSHSNPYFLDRYIEPLAFLEKEKEQLLFLLSHPALPQKEAIATRLAFLSGAENRLSFREENISTARGIKETEEKQRHPIQLDLEDLQKLLSRIENCPIGSFTPLEQSPQLLITEMKLRQIQTPLQNYVFELELQLLNREFTQ
jgi:hypothetical protein